MISRRKIAVIFLGIAGVFAGLIWLEWHTNRYDHIISQAAARNGVDFYLVKALIFEESWFEPDIKGSVGELGLMQVTRAAAKDFTSAKGFPEIGADRLLDPELNVEIGCWYLRDSLDLYRKSPAPTLFALLRYNAGEGRTDNWLKTALANPAPSGMSPQRYYLSLVDFPKTREYARRILERSQSHNFIF